MGHLTNTCIRIVLASALLLTGSYVNAAMKVSEVVAIIESVTTTTSDTTVSKSRPRFIKYVEYKQTPRYGMVRVCNNGVCRYVKTVVGYDQVPVTRYKLDVDSLSPESAPTPMKDVAEALKLLDLNENDVLVDYGCGYDARYLITAHRLYGCKGIGIEIDPDAAKSAREFVESEGMSDAITIIEGDATEVEIKANKGVAYLYPETLKRLAPKIKKLGAFVSYQHEVPSVNTVREGSFYLYKRPEPETHRDTYSTQRMAEWGGYLYSGPVCNNPNCRMCNSIRRQLGL